MNIDSYFENIKTYKLLANKSLGQNFLINPGIAEEIVKIISWLLCPRHPLPYFLVWLATSSIFFFKVSSSIR